MLDDLPYGFSAPITALQVHNNRSRIYMYPGKNVGDKAKIIISPKNYYITINK